MKFSPANSPDRNSRVRFEKIDKPTHQFRHTPFSDEPTNSQFFLGQTGTDWCVISGRAITLRFRGENPDAKAAGSESPANVCSACDSVFLFNS